MTPRFHQLDGVSIFDDKGEVKRLVQKVIEERDPEVKVNRMRKMDFSFVFILSKRGRNKEVELTRSEIEASTEWRKGFIDKALQKKIENTLLEF